MKKILFVPPEPWYVESHIEYLIRYFGHKYFMEMARCSGPYPHMNRNPDDYDLLVPLLATHPGFDQHKYKGKIACILWEPGEGIYREANIIAATTPMVVRSMKRRKRPYVEATPGIDVDLFKPLNFKKDSDLLHVGVIGCMHNMRHRVKDYILPLTDIPGTRFMFFARNYYHDRPQDIEVAGGEKFLKNLVDGNKKWPGIPNVYNRMDVLLRMDDDPGLAFPIMESLACGVPFVATNVGNEQLFDKAGIVLYSDKYDEDGNGRGWYKDPANREEEIKRARKAIEWMRDNPEERKEMGKLGREIIIKDFSWKAQLPNWERFFRRALQ